MPEKNAWLLTLLIAVAVFCAPNRKSLSQDPAEQAVNTKNILFIGNSYTARHQLSALVKQMVEEGPSNVHWNVSTVIYGGRTLRDHWLLGTQNKVMQASISAPEIEQTIAQLKQLEPPFDKRYVTNAIKTQKLLLESSQQTALPPWDIVVLQSYRDDLDGDASLYVKYAPRFAELIKKQGGQVVLYETTPTTQNAAPLKSAPDDQVVLAKAKTIAALGKQIDASVVPMSLVAHQCQLERPDLTLRFVNDAHLNQTLAYLTACTFYAVLTNRSPQGLTTDRVTDIRFLDAKNRDKDRDGKPLTKVFGPKDRRDLQRIAWTGLQRFEKLQASLAEGDSPTR